MADVDTLLDFGEPADSPSATTGRTNESIVSDEINQKAFDIFAQIDESEVFLSIISVRLLSVSLGTFTVLCLIF